MQITLEDLGTCLKKINVEIPPETVKSKLTENYRKLGTQVQIPGFRPGKAPLSLIEKRFGEHVRQDVSRQLVEEAVEEATSRHDLQLLGTPEIEKAPTIVESQPLRFDVTVEVRPEFELPEYKGLEIEVVEPSLSDGELAEFLKSLRYAHGDIKALGEGEVAEKGDVMLGEVSLFVDNERVTGQPTTTIEVGSSTILGIEVPQAASTLMGIVAPCEHSFEVEIPENYVFQKYAKSKGKIEFKVRGVVRPKVKVLDDEFAKGLNFESLEELKDHYRDRLLERKRQQHDRDAEVRLVDMVVAKVSIPIPPKLAERQLSSMLSNEAFQLYREGTGEKEIEAYVEKRRGELPAVIEHKIRMSLVIDAIAKKERVFVTEDDVMRAVAAMAQERNENPLEMLRALEKRNMLSQLRWEIKAEKVQTLLRQKAVITARK